MKMVDKVGVELSPTKSCSISGNVLKLVGEDVKQIQSLHNGD